MRFHRIYLRNPREIWAKLHDGKVRSEGKRLGHPKGRLSSVTKLTGKDDLIREYLKKKIPQTVIARLLNVNRLTVRNYILTRKLIPS